MSTVKSSVCKRCALILALSFLLLHFAIAQDTSVVGEWDIAVGPNQSPIFIEQTGAGLTLKATISNTTIIFNGGLLNDSITASSPVERKGWGDSQKPCHDRIVASIQSYPNYRLTLKLKRTGETWRGILQSPEKISCETGTPAITIGQPISVSLRRPSALYWISGKQILKARTADLKNNLPINESVLVTGTGNITSVAVDRNASRVYWSEGRFIHSIRQDGSQKQTLTRSLPQSPPNHLVIAPQANRIFWTEGVKIMTSYLHANQRLEIVQEQQAPASLSVDVVNQKLYWLLPSAGKLRRSSFDGTRQEDYLTEAGITSFTINATTGYVYYTSRNGIKRVPLNGQRTGETIQQEYLQGRTVAVDEPFGQLYWSQNNYIYKAKLDGTGAEVTKVHAEELSDFAIGPMGPAEYDSPKILGQLVIAEAFPGKSLLQLLAKNDTYYEVILSRSQRNDTEFNLTDARLIMIWGENFPSITYKGNNVQLMSKSPFIRYAEFTNWCELLLETQKERFIQYPLWLAEADGILPRAWESALKVVKDSLGQAGLDEVRSKDRMLVLAIPGAGVYPGIKSFTMNDAEAQWYLTTGSTRASMRVGRQLEREDESLSNLYSGDPFFIEIKAEKPVDADRVELSYFVNDQSLEIAMMEAVATEDKKTFRTPPITLRAAGPGQPSVYTGFDGSTEISCAPESVFKVAVSNKTWFNHGNPTYAMAKLIDPKVEIWHQSLGEAVSLARLTIPETRWESKSDTVIKKFSSVDLTSLGMQECKVSLGDYAAMLLLKKYFVRQMEALKVSLESNKNEKGFQYGFWESMAPNMEDPDFPLGDIEVTEDEVELRNAFSREYILGRFSTPQEAKTWIAKAKADGFTKYLLSIDKSLRAAANTADGDIEAMMNLTGFGFNAMIGQVTSDMMKKEYLEVDEGCTGSPYKWTLNNLARAHVKTMCLTAEHCKANEELQAAGTDVVLAAASLLVFPIGAWASYGKLAAGIYGAALGSGELARDHLQFKAEDQELEFASGTAAVLGSQRYTLAKLQVTPTWARMLSYFGGAAGILGDASDIVKNINRVDMSAAYRQLPSLANKVNEQGALKAFEAMSSTDKSRFLLLLGEAETLKKLPADQLNDAQRKLVQMAEQFETQIDAAARARTAVTEAADAGGETVDELRKGLPAELQDRVPVIKDKGLEGNTVQLRYDLDANGFVTNIRVAAGETANRGNIAEHANALKKMMEYQQVSGTASALYQRIRYWYRSIVGGEPPIGSPAWESMQEVQKLNFIVENRLSDLNRGLGGVSPAVLTEEIQTLTRQLAEQQRAFENFITDPALRRGYVAATSASQSQALATMKNTLDDMANIKLKSSSQLTAKSQRLQRGINFLKNPANEGIYDKILEAARGDAALAARLVENLTFVEGITTTQLRAISSFLDVAEKGGSSMAIILQRARHNAGEAKRVLDEIAELSSNADALKGMDVFIQQVNPGHVGTISRLDEFILERKAWNTASNNEVANILETINEFRGHGDFRKVILNLSKKSDSFNMEDDLIEGFSTNSYRGAVAQLCAARELTKKFGFKPGDIFFEAKVGDKFRFVDIMVKKEGKIHMLVECKEYSKLQNLTRDDIVRQFVKDVLIATHGGISVRNGVRWMINRQAFEIGNSTINLADLQRAFLEGLENETLIAELCCKFKIDLAEGRALFAQASAELGQNMDEIFIPF